MAYNHVHSKNHAYGKDNWLLVETGLRFFLIKSVNIYLIGQSDLVYYIEVKINNNSHFGCYFLFSIQ